jgi:hypothetical protein
LFYCCFVFVAFGVLGGGVFDCGDSWDDGGML